MQGIVEAIRKAARYVAERSPLRPRVGLIAGSGLTAVAELATDAVRIPYGGLPGWPNAGVAGHAGELRIGTVGQLPVAVLAGRPHLYEGHDPAQLALAVRVLAALGCRGLIVTNAAGGLSSDLRVGDLMLIEDHVNLPGLAGLSPLRGPEVAELGTRFVNLRDAYDPELRGVALRVAADLQVALKRGIYAMVGGPNYETPAELRLLRLVGADAVGMSTCPEVLAARQAGLRVLGVSCITNLALADAPVSVTNATAGRRYVGATGAEPPRHGNAGAPAGPSHDEVLDVAASAGPQLASLLRGVLAAWPEEPNC
ncbi:MAG: purine-nucleoside phosphorylase [Chloroflexi bacterium]|nr:purine-nucleoside phosphorylase [Chloroflexota bacterium]